MDISGPVSELGPVELFAAYLKYAADEDKAGYLCELLEYGEGVLDMAEKVFKEVTLDEKAWIEKRSRELAEHNRASELAYAREEAREQGLEEGLEQGLAQGLEQGLEQGIAQGIAQGEASKALEMAKTLKAKGIDIDIIAEVSGLSKDEIEQL